MAVGLDTCSSVLYRSNLGNVTFGTPESSHRTNIP